MLDTIFGLPIHPLVVHATVVMVPLATLSVLLAGVWPRFRRWAGWLPLGLALIALFLVPLSTQSGESLQRRVGRTDLVKQHVQMADGLLPWVAGLVVAAALTTVLWRRSRRPAASVDGAERMVEPSGRPSGVVAATSRSLILVAGALAVVAAAGSTVQVVRIGHSGAEAAWSTVSGPRAAPAAANGGANH